MSLIRATLFLCMTILISVVIVTYSQYKVDRFQVIPYREGIFIFDRHSTATNYCNETKCIVVSSEFHIPKQVLIAEIPGVVVEQKMATATVPAPLDQQQKSTMMQRTPLNDRAQSQSDLVTPNFQGSTMRSPNNNMGNNNDFGNQSYNNRNDQDSYNGEDQNNSEENFGN